ncbi:hypothetical protein CABS01_13456 [Colletotrichum abscissum]|uniref:Uncharacterized protein n=1 Tax=Colletotrichum abscissum TaxID=1671311 RepID=A0A9Q0B3N3_9PEZI|nr:uncharacterized protein CABS01_13456 [Colletotrichum abscissum]KAI3550398.1 hypothetical protein CABS02_07619 [Colletotrichum abscissum]KAK1485763.1 hypothetical protein CABS01_13456 [Colletotrichum abscissum]
MSSPYTIPYKATASTFVPGAAAHPPAPQDHAAANMRTVLQPAVAGQPLAADTSHSNAPVAVGGAPRDAIPAKFSSAVEAAAGGGIAIAAPGGLRGVSGPASAGAANSSGQSGHCGEAVPTTSTTTTTTPLGTDGCEEMEQQLQTTQAEIARLKAENAQLKADSARTKAENGKLREAIGTAGLAFDENEGLRAVILRLEKVASHKVIQNENLFQQMADIQGQALALNQDRDRLRTKNRLLRAELRQAIRTLLGLHSENMELKDKEKDATMGAQILTDMLAAVYNKIVDDAPDIMPTLSERVQKTIEHVYENWKEEQFLQVFHPEQAMQTTSPYDIVPRHTPVPSRGGIEFIPLEGNEEDEGTPNAVSGTSTVVPPAPQPQQPVQHQPPPHIPNHNIANPHATGFIPGQTNIFRLIIDSPGQQLYENNIPHVDSPHTPTTGGPAPPNGGTVSLSDNLYDPDTPTLHGASNAVDGREDPRDGITMTNDEPEGHEDLQTPQTPQTPTPLRHHGANVLGTPDA